MKIDFDEQNMATIELADTTIPALPSRPAIVNVQPNRDASGAPILGNEGDQTNHLPKPTPVVSDRSIPAAMSGDEANDGQSSTVSTSRRKSPRKGSSLTGHSPSATLDLSAGQTDNSDAANHQLATTRRARRQGDDRAQYGSESQSICAPVIAEIVQLVRMRRRWIKAKNALVLQSKAICRGWTEGDKTEANKLFDAVVGGKEHDPILGMALAPFMPAIDRFEADIHGIEKTLGKLAKVLLVWKGWAEDVPGLSAVGLSLIVGECGDIGSYRNPSCVWKRMGLAVHGDHRQGNPGTGATAEDWTFEAYSKVRRSVMWNIGNGLIGGMGKFRPLFGDFVETNETLRPYQRLFAERCRYEAQRLPHKDGEPIKISATGKESYTLHAANRAKRYVEKRFLRDLYAAWPAEDAAA